MTPGDRQQSWALPGSKCVFCLDLETHIDINITELPGKSAYLHLLSHQEYIHSLVSPKMLLEKLTASVQTPLPRVQFQTLLVLNPHLSVIPESLVFRGPEACQTSSSLSKKYPPPLSQPTHPSPTSLPSFSDPPNKNKVT